MNCRFCNTILEDVFADLGETPLANSYLTQETVEKNEKKYPLRTLICKKCFLVQIDEFEHPRDIFNDYVYFSSYSITWLEHVKCFVDETVKKFNLTEKDLVIEIASNDGYLLKNFINKKIPILGIEPAKNIAKIAKENGIPTIAEFFSSKTAQTILDSGRKADLLIAFNVLPHVPNLNDFILGMKQILSDKGIIVIQFSAYLPELIKLGEFDMIYHEHFSYFSLSTLKRIFQFHDLEIFDIKEIPVHGGSLRIFVKLNGNNTLLITENVKTLLKKEQNFGLEELSTYTKFQDKVNKSKEEIRNFFINAKKDNKKIVCYGAAAKGNTVLNFCEIGSDFIDYVVDISPHKQGKFLPGTHIPIFPPKKLKETKPDYIVILAWNLKEEIMKQIEFVKEWEGKFVFLIPEVKIIG